MEDWPTGVTTLVSVLGTTIKELDSLGYLTAGDVRNPFTFCLNVVPI